MKDSLVQLFATLERAGEGQEISTQRARRIKQLMAPFVLRRLKTVVMHGLLPKTEEDMLVKMTAEQQALYVATVKRIADQARERQRAWEAEAGAGAGAGAESSPFGGEGKKWVRAAFVELRKVAQHTLLARSHYDDDIERIAYVLKCEEEFGEQATLDMVRAELRDASDLDLHLYCRKYPALHTRCLPPEALLGSGKAAKLAEMLPPLLEQGHRALIFAVDVDARHPRAAAAAPRHPQRALRWGTAVDERQRLIDEFNGDATIGAFPSTRAGGLGINLTAADWSSSTTPIIRPPTGKRWTATGWARSGRCVIKLASAATVDEQVSRSPRPSWRSRACCSVATARARAPRAAARTARRARRRGAERGSDGWHPRDLLRSDPPLAPPPAGRRCWQPGRGCRRAGGGGTMDVEGAQGHRRGGRGCRRRLRD